MRTGIGGMTCLSLHGDRRLRHDVSVPAGTDTPLYAMNG